MRCFIRIKAQKQQKKYDYTMEGCAELNSKLREKTLESLSAVLPITAIMLVISILLVPVELGTMTMFLVGAVMLIFGMGFFQLGAEMS